MLGTSQPFLWPHTGLEWQLWGYCIVLGERAPFSGTWRTQRCLQITARGAFSCFELTGVDFLSYHTVVFEEKPVSAAVHHWETETARTALKRTSVQIWHFSSEFSGEQLRASAWSLDTAWQKVSQHWELCAFISFPNLLKGVDIFLSSYPPLGNLVWHKIPEGRRYYTVIVGGLLLLGKGVCASHEGYIHAMLLQTSSFTTQNLWKQGDLRLGVGTSMKTSFVS